MKINFFLVPATTIYFGTYEFVKRNIVRLDVVPDTVAHLVAGKKMVVKLDGFDFHLHFQNQIFH